MKKLLIIGSNTIHTYNYIDLVKNYFDDVLLITNQCRKGFSVKAIELDFHLNPSMFKTIREIRLITSEYRPTVVHIHQANSYALITLYALRQHRIPKVLTAWGSDVLVVPRKNVFYKQMVRYVLKNADIITSDSLYMSNIIRGLCDFDPTIIQAHFGITIAHERGGGGGKENIVFSNRLHKGLYNIDKVILTFNAFLKKNPGWKLVVAGVGTEEQTRNLIDLTKQLGIIDDVDFAGWLDPETNFNFYIKAKIYISIPDSDATSISLLEAISNNCICFVSNLPANCEHILDHVNGFIEDDLSDIDLRKYNKIDRNLLRNVNKMRSYLYSKEHSREIFYGIYDQLLSHGGEI